MERYMKIFATSGDVQTAIDEGTLGKPYVAYIEDGQYIDWNSAIDYGGVPLTFEIIGNGVIKWASWRNSITIQYSKNGGEWTSIASTGLGAEIPVVSGDIIRFKGNNNVCGPDGMFYESTCSFNAYGNIMSLINASSFSTLTTFPSNTNTNLSNLFNGCTGLTDASNLVLPVTALTKQCYMQMFTNCISLTSAPKLPATILAESCYDNMFTNTHIDRAPELLALTLVKTCYSQMFGNCGYLQYVKCMATDISAEDCLSNFLVNSPWEGTFVKAAGVDWPRGYSGIPNSWTVIEE